MKAKAKKLHTYTLTMNWKRSRTITAIKDFANDGQAKRWQILCNEICGKDVYGEGFVSSTLSREVNTLLNPAIL